MSEHDRFLETLELISAAGLDEELWPIALRAVTELIGATATTMEVIDKVEPALTDFWSFGVPPGGELEYVENFLTDNSRVAIGMHQTVDQIAYDYMAKDEAGLDMEPFYQEFLRPHGLRYYLSSVLMQDRRHLGLIAVHRSPAQGHVEKRELRLMRRLGPHVRHAYDVTRRLRSAEHAHRTLESTVDWLHEAVVILHGDGTILYANLAARALSAANDGFRLLEDGIELASPAARRQLAAAMTDIAHLPDGPVTIPPRYDFLIPRPSGGAAYLISLRPLVREPGRQRPHREILVFVRDPLADAASDIGALRDAWGLTEAEADLARRLQNGATLGGYAAERGVSINTVYTHLRRIKEKTGHNRTADLVRRLGEMRPPLRR